MTPVEFLSAVASAATAVGVGVAAYQLLIARQQALTSFEDSLSSQYRLIIERLPIEALFGEAMAPDEIQALLPHFYRYFDLCNEQVFLRKNKRVSEGTWSNWEDGIKTNMDRPAFAAAWSEVAARATDDFDHLRKLCPPQPRTREGAIPTPALESTRFGGPPFPSGRLNSNVERHSEATHEPPTISPGSNCVCRQWARGQERLRYGEVP